MRVFRTIGLIVASLGLLAALAMSAYYLWDVAGIERPSDETLVKTLAAHRAEFDQAQCGVPGSEAARKRLSVLGVKFTSCDYDNTLRLGFDGSKTQSAIAPDWSKGLTHIPGDPARHGALVASTDGAYRLSADVYLRPLGGHWFIYFQRDD